MKPRIDQSGEPSWHNVWSLLRLRYLTVLIILAIAGGLAYRMLAPPAVSAQAERSGRRGGGAGGPPIPVSASPVKQRDINVKLNKLLGTVTPLAVVSIKTQIAGRLISVDFKEGQTVKKGDMLAQIDPRPYQFALDQAAGQLDRDKATLRNAELDQKRYKTLVAQDSIAVQQLDAQEALVRQLAGTVSADQALVDTARLNLSFCRIVAPIDGRTGLRMVDPGNYIQISDNANIVVISQVKPISVIFTIPEDELPKVAKRMSSGAILPVTAFDRDQSRQLARGKVQVIDNQIDTTTGTVKLRAVFENEDESLFANQFVTLDLLVDTHVQVPTVASAAIQRGAPGTFVYLIGEDGIVSVRPVKLGQSDGDWFEVNEGLNVGDVVVTDGLDRLKEGAKVIPHIETGADAKTPDSKDPDPARTGDRPHRKRDKLGDKAGDKPGDSAPAQP